MTASPAAVQLAGLLPAGQVSPLELGSLTVILGAICPGRIAAEIEVGREYRLSDPHLGLTARQAEAVDATPKTPACRRSGHLIDTVARRPAARISSVILLRRLPWTCRRPLGLTDAGSPDPARPTVSLDSALRHQNVYRRQIVTELSPEDDDGQRQALYSEAILEIAGRPIGLVTGLVYAGFLDRYPPPWERLTRA